MQLQTFNATLRGLSMLLVCPVANQLKACECEALGGIRL